jgi:hypothetical protein
MALTLSMSIEDIKKKIKEEVPLQVLADMNGLDIKTFENALRQYEKDTGEKILPERKRGRPRTDNPKRSTQYRRAKEAREAEKKTEADPWNAWGREKVLEKIRGEITLLEETIESLENALREHRAELEAWKELEAKYK